MNLGITRLRGRPRNRRHDEVREDGRIVGGEGWQEKVHSREEWKKLLRTSHSAHAKGMNELDLPPPLPQVSGLAVPAAHCGCDMLRGLLAVLLLPCSEQPRRMTGGPVVDNILLRNVRVEDVCVSVLLVLCSYDCKYFQGNCAAP